VRPTGVPDGRTSEIGDDRVLGLIVIVGSGAIAVSGSLVPEDLASAIGNAIQRLLPSATRTVTPEALPPASAVSATFQREAEYWTVGMATTVRLRDAKGLRYLAALLEQPGTERHALDLVRAGLPAPTGLLAGPEATALGLYVDRAGPADDVLDPAARAAYRERIIELRAEVEAADRDQDPGRAERAESELDALTAALAAAYGMGGRSRPGASAAERARQSVTKAIRVALTRIDRAEPMLGRHLERAIRTGLYCCYDPDPSAQPTWRL
jgi:hypothetical protein